LNVLRAERDDVLLVERRFVHPGKRVTTVCGDIAPSP